MTKRSPLVVILVLVTALAAYLFYSVNNARLTEHKLRLKTETELATTLADLSEKEKSLQDLLAEKAEMEQHYESQFSELQSRLSRQETNLKDVTESLKVAAEEKAALQKELDSKLRTIESLNQKIKQLETDKSDLLASLKGSKNPLAGSHDGSSSANAAKTTAPSVELGSILVQKAADSNIKVVYTDPVYGFVIIDAGSKEGLSMNAPVMFVRDKQLVAKGIVQKLRPHTSAVVLNPETLSRPIQVSDRVVVG